MTSYTHHSPAGSNPSPCGNSPSGSARHAGAFSSPRVAQLDRADDALALSCCRFESCRADPTSHGGGCSPSATHSDGGAERRENAPSYSCIALNALRLIDARQRHQIDAARRAHRPTAHLLRALRATTHALMKAEGQV